MVETARELSKGVCCLCLGEDESTFTSNSIMKSLPLHEMVNYCIGIQIHTGNMHELSSTSICNECVPNINSFYTFKKKILDAQELIRAVSLKSNVFEEDDDSTVEFIEDESVLIDLNDEEDLEEALKTEIEYEEDTTPIILETKPSNEQILNQNQTPNQKKKSNETGGRKPANKKPKIEVDDSQKVTIQMNECLICPAILADILKLKDHIDSHSDIKCKACNRQFARYSNLKRHFNSTHSKPKPFQCDLCGQGFFFSVNLQAHAALHYSGRIRVD